MDIFSFNSYVDYIKHNINDNEAVYGYKAKLADIIGIQRSYLSLILSNKANLTLEQAERLTRFWKLNAAETEFFMDMVNRDKAGTTELKNFYNNKLATLKKSTHTLSKRFNIKSINLEAQSMYYSSWLYSAVHILLTTPEYNSDVSKIAQRLATSVEVITRITKDLESIGLIKKEKNKWVLTNLAIHIGNDSAFNSINHSNWRQRAIIDSQQNNLGLHYTAVYSLSIHDMEKIKFMILELIEKTRQIVPKSKEEEVICFTCDFFQI